MAGRETKTLIGYQASTDEVERLDAHWKKLGSQSRSIFLRELVEQELAGQKNTPVPVPVPALPTPPPDTAIREELAALAYVLLTCWQKTSSSSEAKKIIQQFLLSGLAIDQIKEGR